MICRVGIKFRPGRGATYSKNQLPRTLASCSPAVAGPIVIYRVVGAGSRSKSGGGTKGTLCESWSCVRNATRRKTNACASAIAVTARANMASACAWMASIIVPIAGKLAKFTSWRMMTNDPIRVVFRLDPDPVLLGVLRCAVQFQALQAGLGAASSAEFAKASEDVCSETLPQLADEGKALEVTLDTFHDRIEISIHHHGQMVPAVGLEAFAFSQSPADGAGRLNGLELLSRVDRVSFSAEEGVARTTLVKYLHQKR
jgi:hypothetical protein